MKQLLYDRHSRLDTNKDLREDVSLCTVDPVDRTEALFERVQRAANIGTWILHIAEKRLECSEEVYRIFETDPERLTPSYKSFIAAVHPEDRERVNAAYTASQEGDTTYGIEHRLLMPDGRIKYVKEEYETCFDAQHKPMVTYGTVQDITTLKTLEAENATREQLLLRRSKLAQMGEMIDTIAHQWKQPLHQINSMLPSLERAYANDTLTQEHLADKLDEIEMLTTHLAQTVDSFRRFFHPRKSTTPFRITDAVQSAFALIQSETERLNVHFTLDAPDPFAVDGDKEEFIQAILSIFYNALECFKHRNVSEPEIGIKIRRKGTDITISILDNAGGIPEHFVNKVFDLYFTTKINGHGTGLGLYVAKMLIEKSMQGTITVENGSKGAIFTIFLPYKAARS
jgi:PAS domain S-box-containing protein